MSIRKIRLSRKTKFYLSSLRKYDFKASISVFFVALPLCLGISLASNVPVYAGLIAGVIGGLFVTLFSRSELSVSGPAAGLAAISAAAISQLGSIENFGMAVMLAGIFQMLLGLLKLGGFTHFIPSAVIKGMLSAIGILLIAKQIPLLIGYDQPDFWSHQLINIITFDHGFSHIQNLYQTSSVGVVIVVILSIIMMTGWNKYFGAKSIFPTPFVIVLFGMLLSLLINATMPGIQIRPNLFIHIDSNLFSQIKFPKFATLFASNDVNLLLWKNALMIAVVASLETLLSVAAIDKLDPYNRITPPNRELTAQGLGNMASGLLGGLPITAVIVRSSANAEAGARTKLSSILHGGWLLLAILFAVPWINHIPYCVLAIILVRTGYQLAKPKMIKEIFAQGREQFLPFIITVIAILFTDILIGVLIGLIYAIYFMIKHTYEAGFHIIESKVDNQRKYHFDLDQHVSFLNKRRFMEALDHIPTHTIVTIDGTESTYIDRDILEIIQDFRSKAKRKNIDLSTINIPEVKTIELH